MRFLKSLYTCSIQRLISGEANEAVASGSPLSKVPRGSPFESFELSFRMVVLKSLLITLQPHLISSEASHMFVTNYAQMC